MTDESHQTREDGLQLWLELLQISDSTESTTAEAPASAPAAGQTRVESVGRCLRLLGELWPAAAACDRRGSPDPAETADRRSPQGAGSGDPRTTWTGEPPVATEAKRFGRFLICGRLGRGGQNYVFRAHDPVLNRDVALKIPRPDSLASPELRRRFVDESQVLAALRHDNLLSILEAGTVGPVGYLVTPYCAGPTLAEWLHQHEKPVPFQLAARVVRDLSLAVDYVHSRGILHRDIKPSNVLLEPIDSGPGEEFGFTPKLTDFGLARLSERRVEHTATGAVMGTPAYMAPEQAEGRQADIGVATDVYALGVTLYELVTGQQPFRGDSELQTLRLISEGHLLPPHRVRANTPPDLEAICLKCLELEPSRRYHSARDLANDLTAFLEQRPVLARPCGPLRRALKWSRRRPLVAALAASLLVSLTVGLAGATWQWLRAEGHRKTAEENFLLAHDAVKHFHELLFESDVFDAPEFVPLRDEVLQMALPYYDRLLAQQTTSPAIRADIADVYYQLGHVALSNNHWEKALGFYRKVAGLRRELAREEPANSEHRYFLANSYQRMGTILHYRCQPSEAIDALEQAAAIQQQIVRENLLLMGPKIALAETLFTLVEVHLAQENLKAASEAANQAIELLRQAPSQNDKPPSTVQRHLADAYIISARVQSATGDAQNAIEACRRAIEMQNHLMAQNLEMPTAASQLSSSLLLLGSLYSGIGEDHEAVAQYDQAIEVLEKLTKRYPAVIGYHRMQAEALYYFADHHRKQRRADHALRLYQQAGQLWESLLKDHGEITNARYRLMRAYHRMAKTHLSLGRLEDASAAADRGIELFRDRPQQAPEVLAENQYVSIDAMHEKLKEIKTRVADESVQR